MAQKYTLNSRAHEVNNNLYLQNLNGNIKTGGAGPDFDIECAFPSTFSGSLIVYSHFVGFGCTSENSLCGEQKKPTQSVVLQP